MEYITVSCETFLEWGRGVIKKNILETMMFHVKHLMLLFCK